MVAIKCPKCKMVSYTASPKSKSKCAYCSHHYNDKKTEER